MRKVKREMKKIMFLLLCFVLTGCMAITERTFYTRTEGVYVGTKANIKYITESDDMMSVIDFPFSLVVDTLYVPSDLFYIRKMKNVGLYQQEVIDALGEDPNNNGQSPK